MATPRFQLSSGLNDLLMLPWHPQNHKYLAELRIALTIALGAFISFQEFQRPLDPSHPLPSWSLNRLGHHRAERRLCFKHGP